MNISIIAFFLSFILSYAFTWPTITLAKKLKLVTDIKKRYHPAHTHKGIIPRAGGLPIFLSFLIVVLILLPINKILVGILLSSFLLVGVGIVDDYIDTSPYLRFSINLLISALVISFGLGIPYISNPFGGVIRLDQWIIRIDFLGHHSILILADILAIIWLTWTTNAINWSKGVDGQLPGFVGITAIFLGFLSQRFTVHDISINTVMVLCFVTAGAYLGFLPHNFYPQKIMPGYGGGALAGFLLGILSILSFGKIGTALLILSVPLTDAFYTLVRRVKNHRSPFKADWGHLHHKFLEIGWGKRRIAVFYWAVSLIMGIASLVLRGVEKLIAFFTIGLTFIIFTLIIDKVKQK